MANSGMTSTDPVCGMLVSGDEAISLEYGGRTYFFCERVCAEIFEDEPDRWAEQPEQAHQPA